MSNTYVGEIRIFAGNFAPAGWQFCDGSLVAISENPTLFNLIGTTYGGDGQSTFALPDLRSRVPIHVGSNGSSNYVIGQNGGLETVTLTTTQIPQHNHVPQAAAGATAINGGAIIPSASPAGNVWSEWTGGQFSNVSPPLAAMNPAAIGPAGGSQPHDNMLPYQVINYIISLYGIYPSQS